MSGLSLETCTEKLKSVVLTVLELLAFKGHFKLVWLTVPLRTHRQKYTQTDTHTHTNTHIERTHYLRHSLRSLGGDKYFVVRVECRRKDRSVEARSTRYRRRQKWACRHLGSHVCLSDLRPFLVATNSESQNGPPVSLSISVCLYLYASSFTCYLQMRSVILSNKRIWWWWYLLWVKLFAWYYAGFYVTFIRHLSEIHVLLHHPIGSFNTVSASCFAWLPGIVNFNWLNIA